MTRKQAILQGILILSENQKNEEIVKKLIEITEELPLKHWTKESVFDAIEQFKIEHNGRIPNINEFQLKVLPSYTTIRYLFGLNMKDFMDKYYPERESIYKSRFNNKSAYQWLEEFKKKYLEINNGKYVQQAIYDKKRDEGSPGTQTLIKMFNLNGYRDLISLAGLDKNNFNVNITFKS